MAEVEVGDHYVRRWHELDGAPILVIALTGDGVMEAHGVTTARWSADAGMLTMDPASGLDIIDAERLIVADIEGNNIGTWTLTEPVTIRPGDEVDFDNGLVQQVYPVPQKAKNAPPE